MTDPVPPLNVAKPIKADKPLHSEFGTAGEKRSKALAKNVAYKLPSTDVKKPKPHKGRSLGTDLKHISRYKPLHYDVLIQVIAAQEKTAGGVFIAKSTQDEDAAFSIEGIVVGMSPMAFKRRMGTTEVDIPKANIGDVVQFNSYSGQQFEALNDHGEVIVVRVATDTDVKMIITDEEL